MNKIIKFVQRFKSEEEGWFPIVEITLPLLMLIVFVSFVYHVMSTSYIFQ